MIILTLSCTKNNNELFQYVNPFIGTGGHGHTYPGAVLPFGMVQLSPDTRLEGWDGCSGYHYSDSIIYGFSHTHLSGTGVSDYGDLLLMPGLGKGSFDNKDYSSPFNHEHEKAETGYYSVKLNKDNIEVELTVTDRCGFHRYSFPKSEKEPFIIIDLEHRDELIDVDLLQVSDKIFEGKRISKAWAEHQHFYFNLELSEPVKKVEVKNWFEDKSKKTKAILYFDKGTDKILVKSGISFVSMEGAKKNLNKEISNWDFDRVKKEAQMKWNAALSKIQVEGGTEDQKTIFYTALYHTMIAPNLFSDIDGSYRGIDGKVHKTEKGDIYTIFSLWDTFRATHPLYTLIEGKRTADFIRTFLLHYKQGGRLPVWELAANETDCMIGYHSVSVITDAFVKGIRDFDAELAMEAMLHSANRDEGGLKSYKKRGYIDITDNPEAVSKTLEYAYDDWCIAQFAKNLGKDNIYIDFMERAQNYKNVFDPGSGFMRARLNGGWFSPFSPSEVNFNYTEANSWQYSLFVPHDIHGLSKLMGGNYGLEKYLDSLFTTSSKMDGHEQADITGLIGQYAHGNEPSHHMAYLYNFIGKPYKTQEKVRQILDEMYKNTPDGLSGNEDCGQMSAWYVLSAMGFYPVTPGNEDYILGSPIFDKISINLENGKKFVIDAKGSSYNKYIEFSNLNDKKHDTSYIRHQDIINGGKLELKMSSKINKDWASKVDEMPKTSIEKVLKTVPVPYFVSEFNSFFDSMEVRLGVSGSNKIYFWEGDPEGEVNAKLYQKPFTIHKDSRIFAYAEDRSQKKSKITEAVYLKRDAFRRIELFSKYADRYSAGGSDALLDGLFGGDDYRSGFWQGFQEDLILTVDLGKVKSLNYIALNCLQDQRSWIWFPTEVRFFISEDGNFYKEIGISKNETADNMDGTQIQRMGVRLRKSARYIKISAKNYGKCPNWHQGAGGKAWIFADELIIE